MACGPCYTCGRSLPREGRSDMRFCNGTCRMRAWRIGGYVNSRQRARFARQPRPNFHQSPALLRVASHMRQRAEHAEQSSHDWQQQHSVQAQELALLRQENADLRRQIEEARQAQQARQNPPPNALPETPDEEGDDNTGTARPPRGHGPRQTGASADRPLTDLRTRLRHCQQMHRELLAFLEEVQRSLDREQTRRAELDAQLQDALVLAIEGEPPLSGEWSAESAAHVQRRTAILMTELEQLGRHRDQILLERERLSARLLGILTPGQSSTHAQGAGYQAASDALIRLKRDELTLLDAYAVWQSQHMRHVTARTLDPNKPLDEQALEAALAARWRLITQPPLEVRDRRQPPRWVLIGFCLDSASERYLLRQSQRRMDEINARMRTGNDGDRSA